MRHCYHHTIDILSSHTETPKTLRKASHLYEHILSLYKTTHKQHKDGLLANPLLDVSSLLWHQLRHQELHLDDIEALIDYIKIVSLGLRVDTARSYVGTTTPKKNDDVLANLLKTSWKTMEGLTQFAESDNFGIVFTAHPTFGIDTPCLHQFSALIQANTKDEETALLSEVAKNPPQPAQNITLDHEHALAQHALKNGQKSLQRFYRHIVRHARTIDKTQARSLRPKVLSLYSWVGYDIDGRSDISWLKSFKNRLLDQTAQLLDYKEQAAAIVKDIGKEHTPPALTALHEKITAIIKDKKKDIASIPPEDITDTQQKAKIFAQASRYFESTQKHRVTHAAPLQELAEQALTQAITSNLATDVQDSLQILASTIKHFGLGISKVHMRINASQLHNALLGHMEMDGALDDPARRMTYKRRIDELLANVKPAKTHFGSLLTETMSARTLFMLMSQMDTYIDNEQPLRFLIAECETAFSVLAALYFARLFGIADRIDISPLLETEKALLRAPSLIGDLIANDHYRHHLIKRGRLCLQTGYSDAGRHMGQMAAALAVEHTHAQTAKILKESGIPSPCVLFFNTHGESCGRGGHPLSFNDRLNYLSSPYANECFTQAGVHHQKEVSFQGGDGYSWFIDETTAYATLTRILEHLADKPTKSTETDPFYHRPDEGSEITHTVKKFNAQLMDSDDYAQLLSLFCHRLTYPSGSRPHQRQYEGGDRHQERRKVRDWRAIPHNATLHQIGFCANVIGGIGMSLRQHQPSMTSLYKQSQRFRHLTDFVLYAFQLTSSAVFRAYIELYNPVYWSDHALQIKKEEDFRHLLRVGDMVETLHMYPPLLRLYGHLYRDYAELATWAEECLQNKPQDSIFHHRQRALDDLLPIIHSVRLALMQLLFTYTATIPVFTAQPHGNHRQLTSQLLTLDVDTALQHLESIFPAQPVNWTPGVFGVRAEYHGDHFRGYESHHRHIFAPIRRIHTMMKDLSIAVANAVGSYG
ncbi:MAG: phosphoenolpyruvate carboxylase [Alphaproteobacteria bacterium GM7ARS4]|nr:phosphoenolpyruvate carboxylase [Alphaproteobacteria bacterium GM7ARS4]